VKISLLFPSLHKTTVVETETGFFAKILHPSLYTGEKPGFFGIDA